MVAGMLSAEGSQCYPQPSGTAGRALQAMGGFATNGINMTKLESYQLGAFTATLFYADIEGHPDDPLVKLALDELRFFSREVRILGVYPASESREQWKVAD